MQCFMRVSNYIMSEHGKTVHCLYLGCHYIKIHTKCKDLIKKATFDTHILKTGLV